MRYLFVFLLFCFGLAATVCAGEEADLDFNGVRLGQAPTTDMICIRGHCVDAAHKNSRPTTPSYKKALDITHFGNVEITSPRYTFFGDRLCRITFRLDCEQGREKLCVEAIIRELDERYRLVMLSENYQRINDFQATTLRLYRARGGAVIKIAQSRSSTGWEAPLVDISDKGLMDELRMYGNPGYVPKELPRQASAD